MDTKICKTVLEHREQLVPTLFTERQVNLVQKYIQQQQLTPSEQTYFYSAIRRKMEALNSLREEYYITGTNMLPERVEEAKKILRGLVPKRAFISGSFLFKKDYNDIDIFVISKNRNSFYRNNRHFTFITEKDLQRPIFASAAQYSVATFPGRGKVNLKRERVDDILFMYQWIINQGLEGEDQKELRDLLLQHFLHVRKEVPDARSLDVEAQEIKNLPGEKRIEKINQITKALLMESYSGRYLYIMMSQFIRTVKEMGKKYRTENIAIFLHFAKEVQHECRRAER